MARVGIKVAEQNISVNGDDEDNKRVQYARQRDENPSWRSGNNDAWTRGRCGYRDWVRSLEISKMDLEITAREGGHRTRIITAYQPVSQKNEAKLKVVYNQHRRHFESKGIQGCARELFRRHLLTELKKWRKAGDRIILAMDTNDDIDTGKISRAIWGNGL